MTKNLRPCFILFGLLFVAGCGHGTNGPNSNLTPNSTKIYSKAELDKLIVPGMSKADLTNIFGNPGAEIPENDETVLLMYSFPFDVVSREQGLQLIGFTVKVRNGNVVNWSPTQGELGKTTEPAASPATFGEQPFEIFTVSDSLTNVLRVFDSGGSADMSNSTVSPVLTFTAKASAGSSTSDRPDEKTLLLVLNDQDAAKLRELTENNFAKRLLIVCRQVVISAPVVSEPISTNQVMLTVKNPHVFDAFRKQ
jgi:hypothetical protein